MRRRKTRHNPDLPTDYSEWWITEGGHALSADDEGDMSHELYVSERLTREILDFFGVDPGASAITLQDYWARKALKAIGEQCYGDPIAAIQGILESTPKAVAQFAPFGIKMAFKVATGATNADGRLYAMKRWGWKRVAAGMIETWTLTQDDLRLINQGLEDIYPEEEDLDRLVTIEVRSTGKVYSDIRVGDLAEGDLGQALRGARTNPHRQQPTSKRHRRDLQPTTRPVRRPARPAAVVRYPMAAVKRVGLYVVSYDGRWLRFDTPFGSFEEECGRVEVAHQVWRRLTSSEEVECRLDTFMDITRLKKDAQRASSLRGIAPASCPRSSHRRR